jgi:hypothetical protein
MFVIFRSLEYYPTNSDSIGRSNTQYKADDSPTFVEGMFMVLLVPMVRLWFVSFVVIGSTIGRSPTNKQLVD